MTSGNHETHEELARELTASLARLCEDIESRSDPLLEEVAHAMELLLRLTSHAHDHALTNSERLDRLERE